MRRSNGMPKVSVIVPVYNVESYLKRCLDSLVSQTLEDIEIIIINDGSTDGSQDIINEYLEKYSKKIKVFQEKNNGMGSARNYGIENAAAEFIAFVDSDDYVKIDFLEKLYNKAISDDFDLVTCDVSAAYPKDQVFISSGIDKDIKNNLKLYMNNIYPVIWNKLYKREIFDKGLRFKEGVWYEDVEFLYRLYPVIKNIGYVQEDLYYYLQRQGSITYTYTDRLYNLIDNLDGIIAHYKKEKIYDSYKEELEYAYTKYCLATFVKRLSKTKDYSKFNDGVDYVFEKVNNKFPNYRNNKYINMGGFKNLYLKYFNKFFSKLVFIKERNQLN